MIKPLACLRQKKAQMEVPPATFVIIFVAILIIAPLMYHFVNSWLEPFHDAVGTLSPQANDSLTHVQTVFNNFWDFLVLMSFVALSMTLIISAFLIDTHPLFFVVYLIVVMVLMLIAPHMQDTLDNIYDSDTYNAEITSHMKYTDFLRQHFSIVILLIVAISAIVMFAKMRQSQGMSYG